jgi:hypothetical protein
MRKSYILLILMGGVAFSQVQIGNDIDGNALAYYVTSVYTITR